MGFPKRERTLHLDTLCILTLHSPALYLVLFSKWVGSCHPPTLTETSQKNPPLVIILMLPGVAIWEYLSLAAINTFNFSSKLPLERRDNY